MSVFLQFIFRLSSDPANLIHPPFKDKFGKISCHTRITISHYNTKITHPPLGEDVYIGVATSQPG